MELERSSSRARSTVRRIATGLAVGGAVPPALALVGWLLDVPWLRAFGGFAEMPPATAFGILATVAGLRLRLRDLPVADWRTGLALACGAFAIGVGALTLYTYVSGGGGRVDEVFAFGTGGREGEALGGGAGRPSPSTALSLLLLGIAVLVLPYDTRRGHRPADWLAFSGSLIGLFTAVAYPTSTAALFALSPYTAMSLNTAVAILAAGTAILLAYPDRGLAGVVSGVGPGASALRVVLPVVVIAPVTLEMLETMGAWLGVQQSDVGSAVHLAIDLAILATCVWVATRRLDRTEAEREAAERARAAAEANARQAQRVERVAQAALERVHADDVAPAIAERIRDELNASRVHLELDDGTAVTAGTRLPEPAAAQLREPLRVGQHPFGTILAERSSARPFRDEDARLLHLLAVPAAFAIDRARLAAGAQRALRDRAEALERYRILTEMLPLLVWMADPAGRAEFFNQRFYEYTGLTPEQARADPWRRVIHPDDMVAVSEMRDLLGQQGDEQPERAMRLRRRDGSYRWHTLRYTAIRDADGRVAHVLGTCMDVDDQMRLAEDRAAVLERERAARMAAEGASRAKDDFLSTLSHELRTPLTPILAWSELLRTDTLSPEETRAALESIERSARVQSRLIEDLLDVSAIVAGKLRVEPKPMDLAQSVEAAVDAVRPAAASKTVTLEVAIEPDTARLVGDPARLQQVAWNLLTNAVKFTPRGGVVRVELRREGDTAILRVVDSGQGISPGFLPFVFDRFRQADSTPGRQHGGLGLGLAIVRHLVELHGGTVRADSLGEGRGATFIVELPLPPVGEARSAMRPLAAAGESLGGLRVLVVDDDAATAEVLETLLGLYGADVQVAHSAVEALDRLDATTADVLVSDIGMPECDGFELIRRIRARGVERGGGVPAIALTAYARPEDRDAVLAAGFQRHLAKPVEPATLVATLNELRRSGQDEDAADPGEARRAAR